MDRSEWCRGLGVTGALVALLSGCVTESKWKSGHRTMTAKVLDRNGQEVPAGAAPASFKVLGLGPRVGPDPLADRQDPQDVTPEEQQRRREAAIRNRFGSTVLIRGDLVTKRYFMSSTGSGAIFKKLISLKDIGAGPVKLGGEGGAPGILGSMLGEHRVEISYLEKFESVPQLAYGNIPGKPGTKPMVPMKGTQETNDLLLVTAKAVDLAAFEDALNLFYSNIPQVEIEVKVVEFSTSDSLSFGVGGASKIPASTFSNLSGSKLVSTITSSFPLTPPAGSGIGSKGLFDLGGIHDGWQLDATLEVLQAQGRADVLSSPKLVVRNGGTAAIATFTEFPFPKAKIVGINSSTDVAFRPVGIKLGIKPSIAGTETVILEIHADVSAVTGFADTEVVSTPIVSTRSAITSVHVPNRKTVMIGGLHSRTSFQNESKIPILGDIPILGYLFRQTTEQTSETELKFLITPTIRIGSEDVLAR
jgi:type II secretory pathway component GspD/PulD (secretin)